METQRPGPEDTYVLPVSYSQERLWFLDRFEPSSAIYNIPFISVVKGSLHRGEFQRAVNRLVERHESLRTCFVENGGQAAQAIHGRLEVEVGWRELGGADAAARSRRLQEICTETAGRPFDLGEAPLFRIMVVSSGHETTIITTMHHIISDGWSIGVFQRELSALYREELGGRPADLPELPIQYADYAVWQRENLRGDFLERQMAYWRGRLEGAPTVLEIPGDHPRPSKQTFNGAVHPFELAPELTAKARALSLEHEATLFMTLFSAFAVLLYRLSGQTDVLIGTPIAGRNGAEFENLIGFFVNTLVLRARPRPGLSFGELVAEVKETTLGAFQNQDVPFEKLVLELNPERTLSHSPLVQVLFSLQNIPTLQELMSSAGPADAGASRNLDGHTGTAKFDLALFVSEVGDGLQCSIEFNTDLFSPETVQGIGDSYIELVRAIVDDPGADISRHPLMSARKRAAALEACTGRARGFSDRSCHRLFESRARATPDAIAVAHASDGGHRCLTYGQLNADANRLARLLAAGGVRPGDRVGICMERGVHQIVAVLAIVKAGAAYVPLDPTYPRERLEYVLADVGARTVLSTTDTRTGLTGSDGFVMVDGIAAELAGQSPEDLEIEPSPDSVLYVLHTSGSTGRPKGVAMPHRAMVNLAEWQARASGPEAGAVTAQFASLNFDVASQEIFSTLTSGGRLELIDDGVRREGPRLLAFLAARGVTRLFLPPVALEEAAGAARRERVPLDALREVIVAGDELHVTGNVRAWFEGMPGARLVNQYGPTETHVVTAHVLQGPASEWPAHPPIGRPVDNAELYVLDGNLEPVPPMVTGELYIGGAGVALGYLNAPGRTGERFIAHPFAGGGAVLYRTGDLCRYDHEGVVTFVGRADGQIKLRGFRIEPGEVEVALKRHHGVRDAVVVKRRSRLDEDQLVAYLVLDEGAELDRARLRSELGGTLPPYMIPALFVCLDGFPLTGSGKVDRLRLPVPGEEEAALERERTHVAPRTPAERFLAGCWCELLQIDGVGIHDDFFDLGGHSLTATQLVSRIRDRFGLELPLVKVFERPTIELLAVEIVRLKAVEEEEAELLRVLGELESLSEEESQSLLADSGDGR